MGVHRDDAAERVALIIEDTPELRLLANHLLTSAGYSVVEAADGPSGIEAARTLSPSLILLDVEMGAMDGYEVATELRTFTDARIVIMSGRSFADLRERAIKAGADEYLTKPFTRDELLSRVDPSFRTEPAGDPLRQRRA